MSYYSSGNENPFGWQGSYGIGASDRGGWIVDPRD